MNINDKKIFEEYVKFIRFLKNEDVFCEFRQEYLRQHNFSTKNYFGLIKRAVMDFSTILSPTFIIDWSVAEKGANYWSKLHESYKTYKTFNKH